MAIKDRDAIIQRIKKLKAHAESAEKLGSLEEAQAFASKMKELLDEYNISMIEVDTASEADNDILKDFVYTESISYKHHISSRWRLDLINVLTRHNYCRYTYNDHLKTFRIYGGFQNVDVVIWMYHYLSIGLIRLAREAWKEVDPDLGYTKHNFIIQYLVGACVGLGQKFETERASASANVLAVIKYNAAALDKYKEERIGKLGKGKARRETNWGVASGMGYEAGKNYSIGKPVEAEKNSKKYLDSKK